MFVYCANEAQAMEIFKVYRNVGVYALNPKQTGVKLGDTTIPYAHLNFLPSDDEINAVKSKDIKLKKLVKKAVKKMTAPKAKVNDPDAAAIGIGMTMIVSALTSDRRNKKGLPVVVLILDEKDPDKSKIVRKFMDGLLAAFGLKGHTYEDVADVFQVSTKDVKKVLPKDVYKRWKKQTLEMADGEREKDDYKLVKKGKGKKGKKKAKKLQREYLNKIARVQSWKYIIKKVEEFSGDKKSGCTLSRGGADLKRMLMTFYAVELRQLAMSNLDPIDMDKKQTAACALALYKTFSADNLRGLNHSICKQLSKKDRKAVKACNSLFDILKETSVGKPKKAPKIKYGYKRAKVSKKDRKKGKKGEPIKAWISKDKFMKFFGKRDNRCLLVLMYTHITMILLGKNIGSEAYNAQIKDVCKYFRDGFGKEFLKAANEYAARKGLLDEAEEK